LIRIAISTLGCKINQAESAAIIDQFDAKIFVLVPWEEIADIYIINTCTVTNRTDYKSRYLIRQALTRKADNPAAKVVVTGCFAQRSPEEIADLGEVDLVVDNQQKLSIAEILAGAEFVFQDIMLSDSFSYKSCTDMHGHTRAFQKIQDGCDFYCSYCAVPYARGHSRSANLEQVLEQARLFVQSGYKEIVLGGVNLGLYFDGKHDLGDAICSMAELDGLELIRLSSIEPQLFSSALISRIKALPKVCPHFHIPLQSGSDELLQKMGRHYDTTLVINLVHELRAAFPHCAIGFDVITGFPGETDALHEETYHFISSLPLAYLHVFSYSKRKGTPAATLLHQVPKTLKTQRTNNLTKLSTQLQERYQKQLIANEVTLRGIVETHKNGCSEFLSDHFIRVSLPELLPIGIMATQKYNS
jgi:threonylcarbamoyladenosine tRNA methylthiotransferase MtaB